MITSAPITIPDRIAEIRVGLSGAAARRWDAPVHLEAEVQLTAGSRPDTATARLWGLSPTSLQWLEQSGLVMEILSGETVAGTLFRGEVITRGVRTRIEGAEQVTEIRAADGHRIYRDATSTRSYSAGTTREQVLTDLMADAGLKRGYIAPLTPRVYPAGTAWCGRVREILDEILAPDGASWLIRDGALHVLAQGQVAPGNAPLITPYSGLIGSPERTDKGVRIKALLLPSLRPGGAVQVESRMVAGQYRVTKITHRIGSRGMPWETEIVGVPL